MSLTLERAKEVLRYEPETGKFFWRVSIGSLIAGSEAGHCDVNNRILIQIDRKSYKAHRLAWFMFYGMWPMGEVDHINIDSTDNRIANLRDVSRMVNANNQGLYSTNKSGCSGVSQQKGGKWRARPKVMGKRISLGVFDSLEEAIRVVREYRENVINSMVV